MSLLRHRLAPFLLAVSLAGMAATAQVPNTLLHSLFDPGTNTPARDDQFGISVAISGTRVVAGAYQDDTGATNAGSVYVYDLTSATPTVPLATLTNPSPAASDLFGISVAISDTRVVVGSSSDDTGATNAGSAYVYDLASATPTVPVATLTNPSPAASDFFASAVAISGTRVAVGTGNAGSAYVFDLASVTPTVPVASLDAGGSFGSSLAISGTRVVIGAPGSGAPDPGRAYVYDLASTTPTMPVVTLNNPSVGAGFAVRFGYAVAVSGSRVVVGQAVNFDAGTTDAGTAYVYDLTGATPTVPVATLPNPSGVVDDYFSHSVAVSGRLVLVGANGADAGAYETGIAYVYDLASATPTVPVATLTQPNPAENDRFGRSVNIDGTTIVAGAHLVDTTALNRGAAYIFGPRPALNVVPAAPGFATISWAPATSSGFVLQCTDILAPTNWVAAPSGAANPVTIPATNASRFYRLFQP